MTTSSQSTSTSHTAAGSGASRWLPTKLFDPTFSISAVATIAFYALMSQPSMHGTLLHRYTSEHPVEYVIVGLFIWGVVDILFKVLAFPQEMLALRRQWIPPREGRVPLEQAAVWLGEIKACPAWLRESRVAQRLTRALQYLLDNGSAEDYRAHLEYLEIQSEEAQHAKYGLVRFVIWVSPVLGFLGTVIHFGMALSDISVNDMTERLPQVVSALGAAFNTSTTALVAATTMMFAAFVCERADRRIEMTINRLVERELTTRFEVSDPGTAPFVNVVQTANKAALVAVEQALRQQLEAWLNATNALRANADEVRRRDAQSWQKMCEAVVELHDQAETRREERFERLLGRLEAGQQKQIVDTRDNLERIGGIKEDIASLVAAVGEVANGERKLVELQTSLAENLRMLRETQQLDEALHGLSAAIHLLTARHLPGENAPALVRKSA
ncbi:MAG: MotA/TolQ/ExbB proton channel family protein [Pirellulales bacterium]|nr:MotA/TolQ/ExbB proton channel family protein [Pirellulales bacterium]